MEWIIYCIKEHGGLHWATQEEVDAAMEKDPYYYKPPKPGKSVLDHLDQLSWMPSYKGLPTSLSPPGYKQPLEPSVPKVPKVPKVHKVHKVHKVPKVSKVPKVNT